MLEHACAVSAKPLLLQGLPMGGVPSKTALCEAPARQQLDDLQRSQGVGHADQGLLLPSTHHSAALHLCWIF